MAAIRTRPTRVKDVMTRDPVCLSGGETVAELARVFDSNEISGAPVVDGQNHLIGVVSRTDLVHRAVEGPLGSRPGSFFALLAEGADLQFGLAAEDLGVVDDFMSIDPITASEDEPIETVARRMSEERVHRVIVTDNANHPIGIVTALDLLGAFPARKER